eukprot:TRINITY_DN6678_c0_g1_i1.p2 TRINITY_DN6678_c0_g1~~TRINITY_DN6678_c0_g1_i1.p2  ORF type:complete len:176 (-),score=10.32 TRINITY_DN6678_c0_g1_i1:520-1047(-)
MSSDAAATTEAAPAAPTATESTPLRKSRKILVAVDPSDEASYALKWALENVIQPDDKIHLLHAQPYPKVYAGPAGPGFYVPPEVVETMKKQEEVVSRQVLKAAKAMCDHFNVKAEADVIEGEPRESICDAVEQLGVQLLVIGSHGYGAVKRAFLGSVSDYCVHHAACPVVVVRKT